LEGANAEGMAEAARGGVASGDPGVGHQALDQPPCCLAAHRPKAFGGDERSALDAGKVEVQFQRDDQFDRDWHLAHMMPPPLQSAQRHHTALDLIARDPSTALLGTGRSLERTNSINSEQPRVPFDYGPRVHPYAGRFDAFHAVPASVSKTYLASTTTNTRGPPAQSVVRSTSTPMPIGS
jgi:hypothetical protein